MSARPGIGRASHAELRDRQLAVFNALSRGDTNFKDIVVTTRLTTRQVTKSLQRLRRAGEVVYSPNGGWVIAEDGDSST